MSRSSTTISLGDAPGLRRRIRLVGRLRWAAVAAVLAAAVACLVVSLGSPTSSTTLLPSSSTGIVVLDVSASISSDTYARIEATLERLIASKGNYGLVLFSDTAYQALPPLTPARELRPYARFFDLDPRSGPGALPEPPRSPFTDSFSAGTRISTGLALALSVIRERKLSKPAVLLVSDLDDETGDLERVAGLAVAYRRAGIPLHVVGLNAAPEDVAFIRRLAPGKGSFSAAALPSETTSEPSGTVEPLLAAAAVLLALGLGLVLVFTQPLRWEPA